MEERGEGFWSLTYIGVCFFVIYGLAAHGSRELTA
jgi:hypothetical protein